MKRLPCFDPRDRQTVSAQLRERLTQYAPELRLDHVSPGVADALVELYGGMLYETIQQFNRVPYKKFLYFMNLLDIKRTPATPASGYVQFLASPPEARGAAVPRETRVQANDGAGESIVFCTDGAFEAVSAQLIRLILVEPAADCINERLPGEETELFTADPRHNLQCHRFWLGHGSLLERNAASEIEVQLICTLEQLGAQTAARLADRLVSCWEYFDGGDWREFHGIEARGTRLYLSKKAGSALCGEEGETLPFLRCTISGSFENIRLREALLRPMLPEGAFLQPEELCYNDQPIDPQIGGYCFGRYPVPYDCFYIGANAAFSKRGAEICLRFEMQTTVLRQMTPEQQYQFNKMIIDKNDRIMKPEEIFISETVWEYWNGLGWRRLETKKSENPFSCRREGIFEVLFTCPYDLAEIEVNASPRLWVRARVALVENSASMLGDRLLPFVKELRVTYAYAKPQRVETLRAQNNRETVTLEQISGVTHLGIELYQALEPGSSAVYLAFDTPFCGYPVNLYFELLHPCRPFGAIEAQMMTPQGFRKVNIADGTRGLTESGIIGFFLPTPPEKANLFGVEGYFLRLLGVRRVEQAPPTITRILTNVTLVRQLRWEEETFSVETGEISPRRRLSHPPVLSCGVWVAEREGEVEWQQISSLAESSSEGRNYCLDPASGLLSFGDGLHGMPPPPGSDAIRVRYACGGGKRGNLPAGAVNQLSRSLPYITEARGVTATCGGSDWQSAAAVERLGPRRLRHGFRACCPEDYEDLVRERFGETARVRCFPNTAPDGSEKIGAVTVVVETADDTQEGAYANQLCRRIRTMLEECADCMALDALEVIPATAVTLHVTAWLAAEDYAFAAEIERDAETMIRRLLRPEEDTRLIGEIPAVSEFFGALKRTPHVLAVRDVSVEVTYRWNGEDRLADLGDWKPIPFAVVKSGIHRIKL